MFNQGAFRGSLITGIIANCPYIIRGNRCHLLYRLNVAKLRSVHNSPMNAIPVEEKGLIIDESPGHPNVIRPDGFYGGCSAGILRWHQNSRPCGTIPMNGAALSDSPYAIGSKSRNVYAVAVDDRYRRDRPLRPVPMHERQLV